MRVCVYISDYFTSVSCATAVWGEVRMYARSLLREVIHFIYSSVYINPILLINAYLPFSFGNEFIYTAEIDP